MPSSYEVRFLDSSGATLLVYVTSGMGEPDLAHALDVARDLSYVRYQVRKGLRLLYERKRPEFA